MVGLRVKYVKYLLLLCSVLLTFEACGQEYKFIKSLYPDPNYILSWVWVKNTNMYWLEYPKDSFREEQKFSNNPCPVYIYKAGFFGNGKEVIWEKDHVFVNESIEWGNNRLYFATIGPEGYYYWKVVWRGSHCYIRETKHCPRKSKIKGKVIKNYPLLLYKGDGGLKLFVNHTGNKLVYQ